MVLVLLFILLFSVYFVSPTSATCSGVSLLFCFLFICNAEVLVRLISSILFPLYLQRWSSCSADFLHFVSYKFATLTFLFCWFPLFWFLYICSSDVLVRLISSILFPLYFLYLFPLYVFYLCPLFPLFVSPIFLVFVSPIFPLFVSPILPLFVSPILPLFVPLYL